VCGNEHISTPLILQKIGCLLRFLMKNGIVAAAA
jgi:hypothetical protein